MARRPNPTPDENAARTRALVAAGTIHPGALVSLGRDILVRADELHGATRTASDYAAGWGVIVERRRALARDLMAEGRALIAARVAA